MNIDDDVLNAARERARRQNTSTGKIISDLARRGLASEPSRPLTAEGREPHFSFRPFPSRGEIVTNELIDSLRAGDAY